MHFENPDLCTEYLNFQTRLYREGFVLTGKNMNTYSEKWVIVCINICTVSWSTFRCIFKFLWFLWILFLFHNFCIPVYLVLSVCLNKCALSVVSAGAKPKQHHFFPSWERVEVWAQRQQAGESHCCHTGINALKT